MYPCHWLNYYIQKKGRSQPLLLGSQCIICRFNMHLHLRQKLGCFVKWSVSDEVNEVLYVLPITPYNDQVRWYQTLIVVHINSTTSGIMSRHNHDHLKPNPFMVKFVSYIHNVLICSVPMNLYTSLCCLAGRDRTILFYWSEFSTSVSLIFSMLLGRNRARTAPSRPDAATR